MNESFGTTNLIFLYQKTYFQTFTYGDKSCENDCDAALTLFGAPSTTPPGVLALTLSDIVDRSNLLHFTGSKQGFYPDVNNRIQK